jgi:signal transduction histidine kinase/CheY-like chemotaxis protein/HPt (histidine-containing phosphotransfer) domain-containing protein
VAATIPISSGATGDGSLPAEAVLPGRSFFDQETSREVARRSASGSLAYPVLLLLFSVITSFPADHPHLAAASLAVVAFLAILRLPLARTCSQPDRSGLWRLWFRANTWLLAACWAALGVYVMAHYGGTLTTLLFLLVTVGIAGGATTSLAPDTGLVSAYLFLLLGPIIAWSLAGGWPSGRGLGVIILLFMAYLWTQGRQQRRAFADALRSRLLAESSERHIRRQAESLAAAREAQEAHSHELARQVEETTRARGRAEAADRAKSEFLANMSHEMRTPLNGVIGMATILCDTPLTPDQRECAETIGECGQALLTLIDDLLDFTRTEAGKIELAAEPFRLRALLAHVQRVLRPRAGQKGLELLCEVHEAVPDELLGDEVRLRQVLLNVAGNAVKFTAAGQVRVCVRAAPLDGGTELHFSVRDTGPGIPRDKQQLIFEPFVQADSSTTRKFGGAGLGLTICSRLVALMGGRIWVESEPGMGSTFHLTARLALAPAVAGDQPAPAAAPAEVPFAPRSLRVLVVEDNQVNQKLAQRLLERRGHTGIIAEDGRAALEALSRSVFDVILMDIQMPGMSGLEAALAIRQREAQQGVASIPIIALTARAMRGDRERCLEAGMDAYLTKPLDAQLLYNMLDNVAHSPAPARTPLLQEVPVTPAPAPANPADALAIFNAPEALARMGGDYDLLREISEILLERCPQALTEMRQAAMQGDPATLERLAHTLKGSLAQVGAGAASSAAHRLERLAHRGHCDTADPLIEELAAELARFEPLLRNWIKENSHASCHR